MTNPTGSITPPIGTVGTNYGISPGTRTGSDGGVDTSQDKDMFLKLLVAQMRYQDPSKPTDASQFLAQTAQFTLVERMDAMAKSQVAMVAANQLQAATALVGRTITYTTLDTAGATVTRTGVVGALTLKANVPTLIVGSDEVSLDAITKVTNTPATNSV
jgi:flagellar basal-body rod modification protein FlgD